MLRTRTLSIDFEVGQSPRHHHHMTVVTSQPPRRDNAPSTHLATTADFSISSSFPYPRGTLAQLSTRALCVPQEIREYLWMTVS